MFRSTALLRQPINPSTVGAIRTTPTRAFSTSRPSRFDPKDIPSALLNSPVAKMFKSDPDALKLFNQLRTVMDKHGLNKAVPPSKIEMAKLVFDADFRACLTEGKALLAKHNISEDEVKKLGEVFMKSASSAASTLTSNMSSSPSPTKDSLNEAPSNSTPSASTPQIGDQQPSPSKEGLLSKVAGIFSAKK